MKLNEKKLKKTHGYEEGKVDAVDPETGEMAMSYKKDFLKKFIAISPQQVDTRLGDDKYYVTRKYDGEYAIIFHEEGDTMTLNRSGRVRRGIPCIEEAGKWLAAAGIKQAVIPAEIYVYDEKKRTRTNDLITVLADEKKLDRLRLAVFDILQIDGSPYRPENYAETIEELRKVFAKGTRVHVVDMETAYSTEEVKKLFTRWVGDEGAEGLVVRSDMPFIYKIKPRHNIDAVIIGFTEGTGSQKKQVRTLLVALMPRADQYQVVGHIGGGFTEKQKKELYAIFSKKVLPSEYIETDSNHVAFHLIEPERVVEFSVNDVISETANGLISNPVLEIAEGTYRLLSTVEGISFVAPVFERFRDDKKADAGDVRLSQAENLSAPVAGMNKLKTTALPTSELLAREVYKKVTGNKVMLQKYMVWKTRKEKSRDYPAYVFYYLNFSSERLQPVQREVEVSGSRAQIFKLLERSKAENLKKGWNKIERYDDRN